MVSRLTAFIIYHNRSTHFSLGLRASQAVSLSLARSPPPNLSFTLLRECSFQNKNLNILIQLLTQTPQSPSSPSTLRIKFVCFGLIEKATENTNPAYLSYNSHTCTLCSSQVVPLACHVVSASMPLHLLFALMRPFLPSHS